MECLALKESANNEVLKHFQCEFLKGLKKSRYKNINKLNFVNKNGEPASHKNLDTPIDKLRVNYKSLKQVWSKLTDRMKNGSRLAPDETLRRFKHLS